MEPKTQTILVAQIAENEQIGDAEYRRLFEGLLHEFDQLVAAHNGELVGGVDDGLIARFSGALDAARCAVQVVGGIGTNLPGKAPDIRVGIDAGDDARSAVELAGRLDEAGICVSKQVHNQISGTDGLTAQMVELARPDGDKPGDTAFRLVATSSATTSEQVAKPHRFPWQQIAFVAGVALILLIIAAATWQGKFLPNFEPEVQAQVDLPDLPSGPKIAIIPFASLGSEVEDAQLAAGITEDIATTLSRFSDLFVFSVKATAQYQGQSVDPRKIEDEIGAQYVLEGSIRRSQTNLRVIARLLDASDAQLLWSRTYDRNLTATDIFEVMDEITEAVVGTLGSNIGVITLRESLRVRSGRTESLQAYECTALTAWYATTLNQQARKQIHACLEKAVKLSPNYSKAWSDLANILIETYKNETFSEDKSKELLERADSAAQQALEVDNGNEMAYYLRAIVSQLRGEGYESFKALADKALQANPNNAVVVGDIGNFSFYSGDFERGKALVGRMMKINPRYPSWAHFVFFLDHYRNANYPEALSEVLKITAPTHCMVQWSKAAAYGKVGETEKGMAILTHIATIDPACPGDPSEPFRKRGFPSELVDSIIDGLQKAGLEEG